jgi:hypothetical protein
MTAVTAREQCQTYQRDLFDFGSNDGADLLTEHGVPYYLKIDIEGADRLVLQALRNWPTRSPFISVEEYGVADLDDLYAIGYQRFAIVPQNRKTAPSAPEPAMEGNYARRQFNGTNSGVFGKDRRPLAQLRRRETHLHEHSSTRRRNIRGARRGVVRHSLSV